MSPRDHQSHEATTALNCTGMKLWTMRCSLWPWWVTILWEGEWHKGILVTESCEDSYGRVHEAMGLAGL